MIFYLGKNAVIIGGTKGIGRGIAIALASAGANVAIVGRSPGVDVLEKMKLSSLNEEQRFSSYPTDLTTVTNCKKLAEKLHLELPKIDILVFTIGAWPDSSNLYTSEGKNRVISLDVTARFVILHQLLPYLHPNARVMSVLASTLVSPPIPFEFVKSIIDGTRSPSLIDHLFCGFIMDSIILRASQLYPEIKFVGTHPGFVETELLYSTFPKFIVDFAFAVGKQLGIILSELESGTRHAAILATPSLNSLSFYDETPVGRLVTPKAVDEEFQGWIWSYLKSLL